MSGMCRYDPVLRTRKYLVRPVLLQEVALRCSAAHRQKMYRCRTTGQASATLRLGTQASSPLAESRSLPVGRVSVGATHRASVKRQAEVKPLTESLLVEAAG
ncbi:hypothetical protein NDU88_009448 [Pleurodeles waltl]|uniref:Uncharacterized protein n=1 Tax=Pleurodeles waltl TaxID=8319 RepID=A0AAV7PZG3_PLEWA|nr:hypothetical protein NDU88_009448 [Pleurodeles waltl]